MWRYEIDSLEELTHPTLVPHAPLLPFNSSISGTYATPDGLELIVHVERKRWESEARDRIIGEPSWPLDNSFEPSSPYPYPKYSFRRRNLIVTVGPYRGRRAPSPPSGHPEIIHLAHRVDRNIVALQGTSKRWDLLGNRIFQKQIKPPLRAFSRWFENWKDERFP